VTDGQLDSDHDGLSNLGELRRYVQCHEE
jgi:hypothetical protein